MKKKFALSSNEVKLIALISMTADHIGMILLPKILFLRIVGRLAFPLFAYMIAEGCCHTRSKLRYLARLAIVGSVMQIVYFAFDDTIFFNVFLTFSLSVGMCFASDFSLTLYENEHKILSALFFIAVILSVFMLTDGISEFTDLKLFFDGGTFGAFLPLAVYIAKDKKSKIASTLLLCALMSFDLGDIQWFCLAAIPVLFLYDGTRGKTRLKYFFYFYYPLHLSVLYLIDILLK